MFILPLTAKYNLLKQCDLNNLMGRNTGNIFNYLIYYTTIYMTNIYLNK